MQDTIERTISIEANIEVVWNALTSADGIKEWFGDEAEIDLRPGGAARFGWTEYEASHDAIIVTVERPTRFSYRWAVDSGQPVVPGPSTLVEFTLEQTDGGTQVRVLESGFASLPEGIQAKSLEDNTLGWEYEMQDLQNWLSASIRS